MFTNDTHNLPMPSTTDLSMGKRVNLSPAKPVVGSGSIVGYISAGCELSIVADGASVAVSLACGMGVLRTRGGVDVLAATATDMADASRIVTIIIRRGNG